MGNPLILPTLIGMGVICLVPLAMLRRFQKKWNDISIELNDAFQKHLEEHAPDIIIIQQTNVPPLNTFLVDCNDSNNDYIDECDAINTNEKEKDDNDSIILWKQKGLSMNCSFEQ